MIPIVQQFGSTVPTQLWSSFEGWTFSFQYLLKIKEKEILKGVVK